MHITELPFNRLIGLSVSDSPAYLLKLSDDVQYTNHVQTVHAAALFALAEGTCGHFLQIHFEAEAKNMFPLLRKSELKYKKPAKGAIYSKAELLGSDIDSIKNELLHKTRLSLLIQVNLYDENQTQVFQGEFEWFVSKIST
ncbi:MAG: YiiD C-terminal domain-containing protein [Bacteroidia bacterium]